MGAKRIHLANHGYPTKAWTEWLFTAFPTLEILTVPKCIFERVAKAAKRFIGVLCLPMHRRKFWTPYVEELIKKLWWAGLRAEDICVQLYYSGIRLKKRTLLKHMYARGMRINRLGRGLPKSVKNRKVEPPAWNPCMRAF
jgi:hypothetical protein